MKNTTRILATLLLTGLLISFDTIDKKLKDGYYTSSHGHATVLYKIDGDNIEWYLDNVTKTWGHGKYKIIQTDSVIEITLTEIKTSLQGKYEGTDFDYRIEIMWDSKENLCKLKDYRCSDNADWINDLKKRIKSSAKISVERPSH